MTLQMTEGRTAPPLTRHQLREEQEATLATPRRRYSLAARGLFTLMDLVYGTPRTLSKFKVLEVIARAPYQAWERIGYVAITHRSRRPRFASRIFERVQESRDQQDNEQWHLLILEELVEKSDRRESFVRFGLLPQVIALAYYHVSSLLYVLRPDWSYRLNADFEDHAEHEYALFVQENPDLENVPFESALSESYGRFASVADVFRQIGHDERVHKEESVARMAEGRFR